MDEEAKYLISHVSELTSDAQREVNERVEHFGPSDFVRVSLNPSALDVPMDPQIQRDLFLRQFREYNPSFIPQSFADDFNRDLAAADFLSFPTLERICQSRISELSESRKIVTERMNSPVMMLRACGEFGGFMKRVASEIYRWIELSHQCPNFSTDGIREVLESEQLNDELSFDINYHNQQLLAFPLIRRTEILETAFNRISADFKLGRSQSCAPFKDNDLLMMELVRLTQRCHIPSDVTEHEGNAFFYYIEKLFIQAFSNESGLELTETVQRPESDLLSAVNSAFVELSSTDAGLLESFKSLFVADRMAVVRRLTEESFRVAYHGTIDRRSLLALFKLRYVLMKRQVTAIRGYTKGLFGKAQHQLIAAGSRYLRAQPADTDRDAVLAQLLELELEFDTAKEVVVNAIRELEWHSTGGKWSNWVAEFMGKRPNLLFGEPSAFLAPFRLAVAEMDAMGKALRMLLNSQILKEGSELEPQVTRSSEAAPSSIFDVIHRLQLVALLITNVPRIAVEFCDSLALDHLLYGPCFSFAIWNQLNEEIKSEFFGCSRRILEGSYASFLTSYAFERICDMPINDRVREFWHACLELRSDVLLAHELRAVYSTWSAGELPDFDFSHFHLETGFGQFVAAGRFEDFYEAVRSHRRFVVRLKTAVRFNHFQSDLQFVRRYFDFSTFIRDTRISLDDIAQKNFRQFVFLSVFRSESDFDGDRPICRFTETDDWVSVASLTDLLTLCQIESEALQPRPFADDGPFFGPGLHPFCSLPLRAALDLQKPLILPAVTVLSSRIRIANLLRLESTLSHPISHALSALYTGDFPWDSQLISHLRDEIETHAFVNIPGAFQAFEALLIIRLRLAVLAGIEASSSPAGFKAFWASMDNDSNDRYLPNWMCFCFHTIPPADRVLLIEQLARVDTLLSESLIRYPQKPSVELLFEELKTGLENFAKTFIAMRVPFFEITIPRSISDYSNGAYSPDPIENVILEQQYQLLMKVHERRNILLAAPCSIARPDFYGKHGSSARLYAPPPTDVSRQFDQELNYRLGRIFQQVSESRPEGANSWLSFDSFFSLFLQTWSSYLSNILLTVRSHMDDLFMVGRYQKLADQRCSIFLQLGLLDRLHGQFMKANQLRDLAMQKRIEQKRDEAETAVAVRGEFDQLVSDLRVSIDETQEQFWRVHSFLFDGPLDDIDRLWRGMAKTRKFDRPVQADPCQVPPAIAIDIGRLNRTRDEIEDLKKDIVRNRIYHVLMHRMLPRFYPLKMALANEERKRLNADLWKSRRGFDDISHNIQLRIASETTRLSECELETEALKSEIEIVKQETTQRKHWKEVVLMQALEIEKSIKNFGDEADIDVQDLLRRLESAQAELDALETEADVFETEVDYRVREPMAKMDSYRRRMVVERAHLVPLPDRTPERIEETRRENEAIAAQNEKLRSRIFELEKWKGGLSREVAKAIEDLTEPLRAPRPLLFQEKRIFKPMLSPGRAVKAAMTSPRK